MRISTFLLAAAVTVHGCSPGAGPASNRQDSNLGASDEPSPVPTHGSGWDLHSSGEGVLLALQSSSGATAIRLYCSAKDNDLLVNVPEFRPIGSEERLSFGSGDAAAALVADTRGDPRRGGVSGTGRVPDNLAALVAGPISASYGAQTSGPHAAPPANLARAFVAACSDDEEPREEPAAKQDVGACRTQDGKILPPNRLKAIGTEPFWAARIEGRCVTYSHPENQEGTRVWTNFSGTAANGSWRGALGGSPFVLRTRPQAGCSDGMSDNRYPIAVTLTVNGEQRTGCAAPS